MRRGGEKRRRGGEGAYSSTEFRAMVNENEVVSWWSSSEAMPSASYLTTKASWQRRSSGRRMM